MKSPADAPADKPDDAESVEAEVQLIDLPPQLVISEDVATITLRRPGVANRLTPEDLAVLQSHFEEVNRNRVIRVLRLESTGKYFCSGYDIDTLSDPDAPSSLLFGQTADQLESLRPVTIAVLQGGVYGGATDLALACDFRVGSTQTNMFMPATRLGLHFYPGGLRRYVQRLGVDQAKRLFLTAQRLDAERMYACGFLTDLVDACSLTTTVEQLSAMLCEMAPLAVYGVKFHLNEIADGRLDIEAIERNVRISEASADLQEGARAWREKRKPRFTGN